MPIVGNRKEQCGSSGHTMLESQGKFYKVKKKSPPQEAESCFSTILLGFVGSAPLNFVPLLMPGVWFRDQLYHQSWVKRSLDSF